MELDFGTTFQGIKDVVEVELHPWMQEKKFTLVQSIEQLKEVIDKAIEAGEAALDLETEGLDNRIKKDGTTVHKIVGYCIAYNGDEGFYIPVRHKGDGKASNLPNKEVVAEIKRMVSNCVTIYHNAPFDHEFLYGEGIDIDSFRKFEDTLILDYLRDSSDKRHGLKHLSERFLGLTMINLKELFPEGTENRDFSTLDPAKEQKDGHRPVVIYAGSDAICTYLLFQFYKSHAYRPVGKGEKGETIFDCVPESNSKNTIYGSQPFVYYIEKINVPALRWMERNRPLIDRDYLRRVRGSVDRLMTKAIQDIAKGFQEQGVTNFTEEDVSSPKKLGEAIGYLRDEGRLTGVKLPTTANGQIQTSDDVITELVEKVGAKFPFLKKISIFRKLQKTESTYLRPLYVNSDHMDADGRYSEGHALFDNTIRFSFLANRVDTGRYAGSKGKPTQGYSGINVQSLPAGYNVGKFSGKRIISRPSGEGAEDAQIYPNLVEAMEGGQGFLIEIYDNHFVMNHVTNTEYCVRSTCEGCPFVSSCQFEGEPEKGESGYDRNVKILSLDASARPAIKAREGYSIVAVDQSGVELRVAASISQEPKWIEEFYRCSKCNTEYGEPTDLDPDKPVGAKKYEIPTKPPSACTTCGSDKIGDLHTLTTKLVYGDEVVKKPDFKQYRQRSKGANFSILYGGSGSAVARSTGVSREEGNFIRNKVLSGLPRLNKWFSEVIATVNRDKQVQTGVGRIIRLGDIDHSDGWISSKAERNAINSIIQGTATGDLTKYCMGRVYQYMKKHGHLDDCRLIITVHDELVFEIKNEMMDKLIPEIIRIMTELGDKLKWAVPLSCDVEIGPNFNVDYSWTAMHTIDPETGEAMDPVPKYLWHQIEMKNGMWYIDDEGNKVVIKGIPDPEENLEERSKEQKPTEEPLQEEVTEQKFSDARDHYMTIKKGRSSVMKTPKTGPIFAYRLEGGPGMQGGDPTHVRFFLRHLYHILDFFKVENTGTHALHLTDWQGLVIIDSDEKHLIQPAEFLVLARFFGIFGQQIS